MTQIPKLWCFFGVHEYQVIRQGWTTSGRGRCTFYDLRCKICGKMKAAELW